MPAYGAVQCQRTEPGGGWRKDREGASHNRLTGNSKGFWDDSETVRDRDVANRSFPHRRYKPAITEAYFDRESGTVSLTVNEARSFPTVQNSKLGGKQVRGRGENRTS